MKLHPLHLLTAALVWNFRRGQQDKPTICSSSREEVGPATFILGWATLTSWLVPHYVKPFFTKAPRTETCV